jgi:hypothetical protein
MLATVPQGALAMPINRVRLQRGMSIPWFMSRYASESRDAAGHGMRFPGARSFPLRHRSVSGVELGRGKRCHDVEINEAAIGGGLHGHPRSGNDPSCG